MNALKVFYKNRLVGILSDVKGSNNYAFRYDDEFLKSGINLCPLLMPLEPTTYIFNDLNNKSFKGLPPLLIDSLPDKYGSELLFAFQKMYGKTTLSPIEALSYVGKRGMGALEFFPAKEAKELTKEQIIEIDSLSKVAEQVLNHRSNIEYSLDNVELKQLISVGSSIGGARAKAIVAIDKDGNIKSGQISGLKGYEYCIIKFDGLGADLTEEKNITYYTRIEYAYYLMAIEAGINMTECSLLKINNKYHFRTKRFDRDENGNKIHMLSLSGMAGFDFLNVGEHSYEEVAIILQKLNCKKVDIYQLFKRMVFNVVCKNHDDHVKNISFLMNDKNEFMISPAYDVIFSYNPNGDWTKHHQMSINNKVDDIKYDDLISAAITMDIDLDKAKQMIKEVVEATKKFSEFAKKAEIPDDIAEKVYKEFVSI